MIGFQVSDESFFRAVQELAMERLIFSWEKAKKKNPRITIMDFGDTMKSVQK
jgi:hypothetical protein